MDREKIIIMIDRLVDQQDGDLEPFKRFLSVRKAKQSTATPSAIWLPLVSAFTLLLIYVELQYLDSGFALRNWILFTAIGLELLIAAWVLHHFGRKGKPSNHYSKYGMRYSCVNCQSELDKTESVLGAEVWVGPMECPQCGYSYPAVE